MLRRRAWLAIIAVVTCLASCLVDIPDAPAPQEVGQGGTAQASTGAGGSPSGGSGGSGGGGLAPPNCTHYASPMGGGDGSSEASPFLVSQFWEVAQPGHTLCLLDGVYRGDESMINPPDGLSGKPDQPIVVSALHDGAVLVDGENVREPVRLYLNNGFVVQRLDACCSGYGTVTVSSCSDVTIARIVAWDAAETNQSVFGVHYDSVRVLVEDCAALGIARSNISASVSIGPITFRRVFARLDGSSEASPVGVSARNMDQNVLFENIIVTADGTFEPGPVDGVDNGDDASTNNNLLGLIVYHVQGQAVAGASGALLRTGGRLNVVKDVLVVVDGDELSFGSALSETAVINSSALDGVHVEGITLIGGPGSLWWKTPSANMSQIIAMNAWPTSYPTYALETGMDAAPPDYVMVWNNAKTNFNLEPTHWSEEDPNLVARCGNVLQYGCTSRPAVAGQPVGAQLQCRYEDGVLTDKPLWPWPMNERIRRRTCEYDGQGDAATCASNPALGVDVTTTLFELYGGSVPNFAAMNPTLCPGG